VSASAEVASAASPRIEGERACLHTDSRCRTRSADSRIRHSAGGSARSPVNPVGYASVCPVDGPCGSPAGVSPQFKARGPVPSARSRAAPPIPRVLKVPSPIGPGRESIPTTAEPSTDTFSRRTEPPPPAAAATSGETYPPISVQPEPQERNGGKTACQQGLVLEGFSAARTGPREAQTDRGGGQRDRRGHGAGVLDGGDA
jgi:hypothetical protein